MMDVIQDKQPYQPIRLKQQLLGNSVWHFFVYWGDCVLSDGFVKFEFPGLFYAIAYKSCFESRSQEC